METDSKTNLLKEASDRPQVYSSPAIIARRQRILEETRKIISEQGISALSMNEVGLRAGVAKRTLYNAFQTRERMIATAIQEYFDEFVGHIHFTNASGTMMHNLERMISVVQRNRQIRNYIKAIMSLYFSPDADSDIWLAMHSMATRPNLKWLKILQSKKQLQPWVHVERLAEDAVRIEYAIINDWALGRFPDDEIVVRLITSYLTFILGATRGPARKEIEELLKRIDAEGVVALPEPKSLKGIKVA
ncbi:MAG: TetR/AcrR family transcriptional regulator [Alphaproteobacteria bacterium]|nr:TetR/AcrR family transcriptional regulator [Alphaproteobacteria bacterium]